MRFKESRTRYYIRLTLLQNADQMKELPKYYVWFVTSHEQVDAEKLKYLHKEAVHLHKLIRLKVKNFYFKLYVSDREPRTKEAISRIKRCSNLRQLLTVYVESSQVSSFISVSAIKASSRMTGKKPVVSNQPKQLDVAQTPISDAKGLNSKYAAEAPRLDIHTIGDALLFFPNGSHFQQIDEYVSGHHFIHHQNLKFQNGKPISADVFRTSRVITQKCRNGSLRLAFHCVPSEDKTALKTAKQLYHDKRGFWINTFGLDDEQKAIDSTQFYRIEGKWDEKWNNITVSKTQGREEGHIKPYHGTKITTIGKYTQKTGVPEKDIQRMMKKVVPQYSVHAKHLVPQSIVRKHHLMDRGEAIFNCHFPKDEPSHRLGLKSERFQELYHYADQLARLHHQRSHRSGFAIKLNIPKLQRFIDSLPYRLTRDQRDSVNDILYDLKRPYQMARLLQGDVGSGKTVVAAFGILAVIEAGFQAAIMIPTTVLGEQHYLSFTKMFKGLNIRIGLLTGKTSIHDKRIILKKLAQGKIDLLIGTEALYQRGTNYKKLGLVVIDEQHRFGVNQRKQLEDKTQGCNVLSMTATPIPRTLASAMYNAMDVSQIRTMPKGRKPIKTKWVRPKGKIVTVCLLLSEIAKRVKEGGQTFIVAKLVRPSRNPKMKNVSDAQDTYEEFKQGLSDNYGIKTGLVTGQTDPAEKDKRLEAFSKGKFQVLVATSVIEVGVDIPKANNMIILDADHYGLAQLHQLRGRVGRNSKQAYCLLVADPTTGTGKKRMKIMENNNSGFRVSEEDLKLRHGGNVFGNAQHGLPDFPLADLGNPDDIQLFQIAQQDVSRKMRD